ncbi:NAD(P)-binding protein [Eremomyces bilateralis CBS 781.70]|uniref:NAD(P)-binding protein n=1 Tax=Eremomyces bilateralis CBS 781.70 TaxID=1392243 RepID=A0A6G1FQ93_9PEZI|nr:NAD(P)-binding protein [Eremomyces bilateralis CBS 781.70]KAF1807933.1 NAD(P)-binding protein [Eremomyces bilateralis CBS 781.70]
MSSIVAVAGGTGGLGRTIVGAIVGDGKYEVIVLSRKADAEKEKEIGVRIVPVDYTSVDALVKVLEENKVDTILATVNGQADPEVNLIAAADKATSTKRYVPTVWGVKIPDEMAALSSISKAKHAILAALAGTTSLEYTVWYPGFFSDYYVAPNVKTHMSIINVVIDVPNNTAAIPGSGDVLVVLTHSSDIAKFAAASLALPKWQPETYLIGDKVTWNEVLAIAEEAKGVKFQVAYDSIETLKSGKVTELPGNVAMYPFLPKEQFQSILSMFGILFSSGYYDFKPEHPINESFPEIKTRTVKELMTEAWKGK